MPLLPGQRQRLILERLRREGAVETTVLALQLGTSTVTVRRDLDSLIRRGVARRVHGGAVAAANRRAQADPAVLQRLPGHQASTTVPLHTGPLANSPTPTPDCADHHFRSAQRILAVAESRLQRNQPANAREWRLLAELHLRLAEYARSPVLISDRHGRESGVIAVDQKPSTIAASERHQAVSA